MIYVVLACDVWQSAREEGMIWGKMGERKKKERRKADVHLRRKPSQ